jgi:hypothetical protein
MMYTDGMVMAVDRAGKSFTAQSSLSSSTYKTTDHTVLRLGTKLIDWAAVKAGAKVGITYHLDGRSPVADEVVIGG